MYIKGNTAKFHCCLASLFLIVVKELKCETFLTIQTSNSRGETASTKACKYVTSVLCYGYAGSSFFFNCVISEELFSQRQEICFTNATFKYCFQLTSILFWLEKTARNPEFDYDHFELAGMDISECKATFILKTLSGCFA